MVCALVKLLLNVLFSCFMLFAVELVKRKDIDILKKATVLFTFYMFTIDFFLNDKELNTRKLCRPLPKNRTNHVVQQIS